MQFFHCFKGLSMRAKCNQTPLVNVPRAKNLKSCNFNYLHVCTIMFVIVQ